ncbi:MAG: hypothetical protein ACKOET_00800 [Verrucomicrobiota bacterium]
MPSTSASDLQLEVLAPVGREVILETTTDLNTWVEERRFVGQGGGTPVRISLTPDPGQGARFWRVRRD